jgi:glycosyltransferase involved in cell wall biosynthesis
MITVLVEGWIKYPHSYSIVNVYQLLALRKNHQIRILFHELPPYKEEWRDLELEPDILITNEEWRTLNSIEKWNGQTPVDIVYRIVYPYDLKPTRGNLIEKHASSRNVPTVLFYTAEFGVLHDHNFLYGSVTTFVNACFSHQLLPITPSNWSAQALRQHNFEPLIIPHGVDTAKYYCMGDRELCREWRTQYDIPYDAFVFLTIGAMTGNKNIKMMIKSFYKLTILKSQVYLVMKGIKLYPCEHNINMALHELVREGSIDKRRWKDVAHRLVFIDDLYSYDQMRILYNTSDCYLSPYLAEGFNLPVLEAAACGVPVIVTQGGSTDDFTTKDFAKYPKTYPYKIQQPDGTVHLCRLVNEGSLLEKMLEMVNDVAFRERARVKGAEHVNANYTWELVAERLYNFFLFVTPQITPQMTKNCHSQYMIT